MSLIQKIKTRLFERKLRQLKSTNKAKRQSVSLKAAKTVGLLFEGTNLDQREQVLAFSNRLKKEGKRVRLLGYMDNKVDNSGFIFKSFNNDDLDFSQAPTKSEAVKSFMEKPHDLLINMTLAPIPALRYVLVGSKALFRVGPYDANADYYELMIDLQSKKKVQDYIKQVEFYLNKMHNTYEAAV